MNDNKSRDIFYGVVAIATLIVAIVGATLAYFSIYASSDPGAVNATAATVSINYDDTTKVVAQADELIPSDPKIMQYFYEYNKASYVSGNTTNTCIDANGKQVCSIYRFSASVDTDSKSIVAYLNSENNTFSNLAYAVRDVNCTYSSEDFNNIDTSNLSQGSLPYDSCWLDLKTNPTPTLYLPLASCTNDETDEPGSCWTINGTTKTYSASNPKAINSIFGYDATDQNNVLPKTQTITATPKVYDLVIFLLETNDEQNTEQGATYSGTLKVEVNGISGNGQITGRVTAD